MWIVTSFFQLNYSLIFWLFFFSSLNFENFQVMAFMIPDDSCFSLIWYCLFFCGEKESYMQQKLDGCRMNETAWRSADKRIIVDRFELVFLLSHLWVLWISVNVDILKTKTPPFLLSRRQPLTNPESPPVPLRVNVDYGLTPNCHIYYFSFFFAFEWIKILPVEPQFSYELTRPTF